MHIEWAADWRTKTKLWKCYINILKKKVIILKIWCLVHILSIKANSLTWRNIFLFTGFDSCSPLNLMTENAWEDPMAHVLISDPKSQKQKMKNIAEMWFLELILLDVREPVILPRKPTYNRNLRNYRRTQLHYIVSFSVWNSWQRSAECSLTRK